MNTQEQNKNNVELTSENFANKSSQKYSWEGEFIEHMKIGEFM